MSDLRLEVLADHHLNAVAAMIDDPEIRRFTRIPDPTPADFPRAWLDGYEAGRKDGTREAFAALDADGALVGLALAPTIEPQARELELGYLVARWARGRGVATEMLRLLTRWALDELGAQRITLIIDVENDASRKVAERCGYVHEGVMRSIYLKNGIRVDAGLWSRLPTDPDS